MSNIQARKEEGINKIEAGLTLLKEHIDYALEMVKFFKEDKEKHGMKETI